MSRPLLTLALLLIGLLGAACARTGSAATLPDGSRIAIIIQPDRSFTPELGPERVAQLNQLLDWMQADLVELFDDLGYVAVLGDSNGSRTAPNRYLLRFEVVQYQSASRAGRMFDSGNTGTAWLDTHFELAGPGDAVVTAGDANVKAAPDWTKAARGVNLQMRDAVNGRIRLEH